MHDTYTHEHETRFTLSGVTGIAVTEPQVAVDSARKFRIITLTYANGAVTHFACFADTKRHPLLVAFEPDATGPNPANN